MARCSVSPHAVSSVVPRRSHAPELAADLFVRCLENEGVEYVFGIPGEETLDLSEALDRSRRITFIPTRHEQGAAFMADAYGRLTGNAGVCLATLGPGATNLATGVADANLDHAPLVALTGQVDLPGMHKETHQFIDVVAMFKPMTKWNTRIHDRRMIPEAVRRAFTVATAEKPGATHLELPADVMAEPVVGKPLQHGPSAIVEPDPGALQDAPPSSSSAPAGRSCWPATAPCARAPRRRCASSCRQTDLHVITTFMGKGVVDATDEHFLFTAGLRAQDYPAGFLGQADLVICVGYDLVEWPPAAWNPDGDVSIICIDTTTPAIDAHYVPEVELIGDLSRTLNQLGSLLWNKPVSHYDTPPYRDGDAERPRRGLRRRLPDQAAARAARPAHRDGARRHPRLRRRRPQALGRRASGRPTSPTRCSSPTASPPWASACRRRSPPRWSSAAAARWSRSAATPVS